MVTDVVVAAAAVSVPPAELGCCNTCGGTTQAGADVPRLLEPRVAAHIERGRIAMRKLEEMFAKHPTLQSQEVKVLSLLRWLRSPSVEVAGGERGLDVPVALRPLVQRLNENLRQLLALFTKNPALETQEVGDVARHAPDRHRKSIFFLSCYITCK